MNLEIFKCLLNTKKTPKQIEFMERRIFERAEFDRKMGTEGIVFTREEYKKQLEISKNIIE